MAAGDATARIASGTLYPELLVVTIITHMPADLEFVPNAGLVQYGIARAVGKLAETDLGTCRTRSRKHLSIR